MRGYGALCRLSEDPLLPIAVLFFPDEKERKKERKKRKKR